MIIAKPVRRDDTPLTVVTKRKKRMRQRGDTPPQSSGSNQPVSQPINQLNNTERQRQQQRAPVMFGRATSRPTDTKVIAARRFRKKAVYCLDNINKDCTVDDIKSYVSKLSVEVFTCYKVKPRRRRSDAEENENGVEEISEKRAAFRLCIAADDRDRLLDPVAWPDSIIISEWYFKHNSGNDDKRIRTDSTTTTALSQQQQKQSSVARRQSPSPVAAAAAAAAVPATSATSSATSCGYDDSTILATSMDYHDGC